MDRWASTWRLAKDAGMTIVGLVIIMTQVYSKHPNAWAYIAGLALTGLSAGFHITAFMSGFIGSRSPSLRSPELESASGGGSDDPAD